MLRVLLVACAALAGACLPSTTLVCADGRVCPGNLVCDNEHHACVLPDQETACDGIEDGIKCDAGELHGVCDRGFCVSRCGDGYTNITGEECDDGNTLSNDGCTATCTLEQAQWREWHPTWPARYFHTAAFDATRERLVIAGGVNDDGRVEDAWERTRDVQLGDRWEPAAKPPTRSGASMVFDARRNVIVLFGGTSDLAIATNETWEYDGTWTKRTPTLSPPPRTNAAMAYDSNRQRIVMFGGSPNGGNTALLGDTWVYDGTTWRQITSTTAPSSRVWSTMAHDQARGRTVLFGGCVGASPQQDTWELDGSDQWINTTPSGAKPAPRCGAALEYFPNRSRVVLFGGLNSVSFDTGDTWEYDGTSWTPLQVAVSPRARRFHSLTYDPAGALVLVAGTAAGEETLDEVWQLSASGAWSRKELGFSPRPRYSPMVTLPGRDQVLLFAGASGNNPRDTWTFGPDSTGTLAWNQLKLSQVPATAYRLRHAFAYDSGRDRVVAFGGWSGSIVELDDTWELTGAGWIEIATATKPPARYDAVATYDPVRRVVIMFGGNDSDGKALGDTWEYDGTNWTERTQGGEQPLAFPGCSLVYDQLGERVVLVGPVGDTWVLGESGWTRLETETSAPPRLYATLVSDKRMNHTLLFGGIDSLGNRTDLWTLDGNTWREVTLAGEPPPGRSLAGAAIIPSAQTMVMFGGNAGSLLGDTWLLRFE